MSPDPAMVSHFADSLPVLRAAAADFQGEMLSLAARLDTLARLYKLDLSPYGEE